MLNVFSRRVSAELDYGRTVHITTSVLCYMYSVQTMGLYIRRDLLAEQSSSCCFCYRFILQRFAEKTIYRLAIIVHISISYIINTISIYCVCRIVWLSCCSNLVHAKNT